MSVRLWGGSRRLRLTPKASPVLNWASPFYPHKNHILATKTEGSGYKIVDGVVKGRTQAVWFTNIPHAKREEELTLFKAYSPERNPHYINYDAIEVSKVKDIPEDRVRLYGRSNYVSGKV